MIPVRHTCHCRLFDSAQPLRPADPARADVAVKCPRCSRATGRAVVVGYRMALPRWAAIAEPRPVLCLNSACLHRVADIALFAEYVGGDDAADLTFKCPSCGTLVRLRLGGVGQVLPPE